jgi:hypothetical protein
MSTTRTRNGGAKTNGTSVANLREQLATLAGLLTREDLIRTHGMQYGTERDLYKVGGYPDKLKFADYHGLYLRDGIAGQVVDMPAGATWRKPPEVVEPEQKEGTKFTQAWDDLAKRLGVWQRFERADRLARLGRYSVLLIGTRDARDDNAMKEPMGRLTSPEDVLYLSVYSEQHAQIDRWVTDARDPRFGLPETYKIDLTSGVDTFKPRTSGGSLVVHWSRVLHIAEGLSEDEVYGRPALERIYNDLHDLQKVSTSTGEAYWQRVAGILQAVIDPTANVDPEVLKELDESLQKMYHDLKKTFYGRGIELKRLAETEPDPGPAADLYMTKIAAGAGIPKRMLFGSETGERASSEDQKTYLGSIGERQQQHAEPMILRPFVDRLVVAGALPKPGRDGYDVVWPPLFAESEDTIATANLKRAQAAAAVTAIGGNPLDLCEIDEDRNLWLRPTGERGELSADEMEPPEPPPVAAPGEPVDPDAAEA